MINTNLKEASSKFVSLFLVLFGLLFSFFTNAQVVNSTAMDPLENSNSRIIEYIRLSVPAKNRRQWLIAEQKSWEPWLAQKEGFLGRKLLWDKKNEEATLLIEWSTKEQWKSISQAEIDHVQSLFEEISRDLTSKDSGNPFPITFEGELLPQ